MKKENDEGIYRPKYRYVDPTTRQAEIRESAIWWISYYANGKKVRESSESAEIRVARKMRKDRLAKKWQGQPVGPDVTRTTLGELKQMLLDDYQANGRRSRVIKAPLGHLVDFFGKDCRAVNLTSDRLTAFVAHRQQATETEPGETAKPGAANATINRSLAALKRAFVLAQRAGKVGSRPHFPMLREDNRRKGFFEHDDYLALLEHLPDEFRPVAQTAYITGWRITSEILTRQKHNVDLDAGWLRLEPGETKNGEGRMFPLTPELRQILEKEMERTRALEVANGQIIPWLFHREGKPIRTFRRSWLTACKNAGLIGRIPHDFRRTAVRNLERAGVPRSAAMAMVGHKTESIYRRYAIADESMLKDGAAKLATLHGVDASKPKARKVVALTAQG
ncbi:MAG TPA: site-specific integrase [Candidatus Binataceae bacterium]|nr:site-specific integrase [Candidatus Binataceae bacterium]